MSQQVPPGLQLTHTSTPVPIIQGGMGVGISLSGLASAVAEAGGVGMISAAGIGMMEPDFRTSFRAANERALRREIRTARRITEGAIGVNIMMALRDADNLIRVAVEEEANLVALGAGLPMRRPAGIQLELLSNTQTDFVPIVSSARAAKLILRHWLRHHNRVPDGFIVEGPLAGGHLGFRREEIDCKTLEDLVRQTIDVVGEAEQRTGERIAVIGAGGVYNGADIHRMLDLGAAGVQMATRFVATDECDADDRFKQAYVACQEKDLVIIDSPLGLPGRAIRSRFLDEVSQGRHRPSACPWHCLQTCEMTRSPYCIAKALTHAKRGELEQGFAFAGANAHRVDRIVSVRRLFDTLLMEYAESPRSEVSDS